MKKWVYMVLVIFLAGSVACGTDDPVQNANQNQDHTNQGEGDAGGDDLDAEGEEDAEEEDAPGAEDVEADGEDEVDADVDDADDAEDITDTDVDEEPDGNTCETAIDATEGGIWVNETMEGMSDDYDPISCLGASVSYEDRVYFVAPEETTTYEVRAEPVDEQYNPMLYVRTDCSENACVAETMFGGPGDTEVLDFVAEGGETYFIIVDTEVISTGSRYNLMITTED